MNRHDTKTGFIPPAAVAEAAALGLAYRDRFRRGGTMVGLARGRQLAAREEVSPESIRSMYSYFARHEVDKNGKNFTNDERPSNGRIAWLLWGGDAGREWATKIRAELLEEKKNKSLPRAVHTRSTARRERSHPG